MPDLPGTSGYIDAHPGRYLIIIAAVSFTIGVLVLLIATNNPPLWLPPFLGAMGFLSEGLRVAFFRNDRN